MAQPDLVGVLEIAAMMRRSRQWVWLLARRPDFPPPALRRGRHRLWRRSEVEAYLKERGLWLG